MRLGVHIGIAKGLGAAVEAAGRLGCEAIQIFSSNPNSWRVSDLKPESAKEFKSGIDRFGIHPVALHTPYLLNLAARNDAIWHMSRQALAAALARAAELDGDYVVTHIGSHGGAGLDFGAERVAEAVTWALDHGPNRAIILLEAGSGAGNTVGSTFEELKAMLDRLDRHQERIGVCLDTAHLWAAGYDVSSAHALDAMLDRFDRLIGLARLKLFHCNDTLKELGSRVDRHWHIGRGKIGSAGFRALINHPALSEIAGLIETPGIDSGKDVENLDVLKSLRDT